MIDVSPDAHTLAQILASLQRIETRLDKLESRVSEAAAVAAPIDPVTAFQAHSPERSAQLEELLTALSQPAVVDSLSQLLGHLASLGPMLHTLPSAAEGLSMAVDSVDALAQRLQQQGISLSERLTALETLTVTLTEPQRLGRLQQGLTLIDTLPGALAALVDTLDSIARQLQCDGLPITERLTGLAELSLAATEPQRLAALQQLVQQLDGLAPLLASLPTLTGLISTTVDVLDQGYVSALREHPELYQLGQSLKQMAAPRTLLTLGAVGEALSHSNICQKPATLGQLFGAFNDPAVRRTLAFALQFAQSLGRALPCPEPQP